MLTYVAAFDQSSSALAEATSVLRVNQAYFMVASCLEDLLFFRMRDKEWQHRSSLSALMAQYRLSFNLGS